MKKIVNENYYKVGELIEPVENSFIAEVNKKNSSGKIPKWDTITLAKGNFSPYYKVERGEEYANFKIIEIQDRTWEYDYGNGRKELELQTLTVESSSTGKKYFVGVWSPQWLPKKK